MPKLCLPRAAPNQWRCSRDTEADALLGDPGLLWPPALVWRLPGGFIELSLDRRTFSPSLLHLGSDLIIIWWLSQPSSVPSLFSLTHAFSHKKSLMHLIPYRHLLLEGPRLTQSMILRCLWVFLMVAKRGPELLPSHSLPQLKKKKKRRQRKNGYTHCIQSF